MADKTSVRILGARRRNARGEGGRLRTELIEAAAEIMAASGREDQVTVRAVARSVGVAPQSFYLHFATVDRLLWEVYTREFDTLTDRLAAAARSKRAPRSRLDAVCRAYCQFALDRPAAYRLMFSLTGEPDHTWDGKLPGAAAFATLRESVAACSPLQDEGGLTKTTSLLWAGLHGLVSLRNDRPAFPWAPLPTLVSDLLEALLPAPPTPARSGPRPG